MNVVKLADKKIVFGPSINGWAKHHDRTEYECLWTESYCTLPYPDLTTTRCTRESFGNVLPAAEE